jgi:hypothetical protein
VTEDSPSPPFNVSLAIGARQDIQRLLNRARDLGIIDDISDLLFRIEDALRSAPRNWGDPLRRLRPFKAVYYRRMYAPLIVYYSVHETEPMVVIARVIPVPGSDLSRSNSN